MFYRKKKTDGEAEQKKKKKQHIPPPPPTEKSSFFYSNVSQLDQLDDHVFFESIFAKYPQLETLSDDSEDEELKEAIIALLLDEAFVDRLLNYFRLTQYDFFKLICQRWGLVFKGMFLRKI